jgi:hypothetical protein
VIILDWAEAGDLAQLLKARSDSGQPLTTEDVLTLFIQVRGLFRRQWGRASEWALQVLCTAWG